MHKISFIYPRLEQSVIAQTKYTCSRSRVQKKISTTSLILNNLVTKNQYNISSSNSFISRCGVFSHPFQLRSVSTAVPLEVSESKSKAKSRSTSVNLDNLGTWDNHLELPILMESSIKHGEPIPKVIASDVGCYSLLGKRTYQEDRFVILDLPNNILGCAVFDGHGGDECSDFCSQHIESEIVKQLEEHKDLETVLHNTFLSLHNKFSLKINENEKAKRNKEESSETKSQSGVRTAGTTATVCLLRNGVELMVANVGDSQAMLCRLGRAKVLTQLHCPNNSGEKARIVKSGGEVSVDNIGRSMVNGSLNMSRSIGDLHLKNYGVTELPDIRSIRVKHGKDAFLLLITDGIDFVLRHEEIMSIVNNAQDPHQAARQLTEMALHHSSEDNMTAIVVPLGSWGKFTKSESMLFSFGIGRNMSKSSRFG